MNLDRKTALAVVAATALAVTACTRDPGEPTPRSTSEPEVTTTVESPSPENSTAPAVTTSEPGLDQELPSETPAPAQDWQEYRLPDGIGTDAAISPLADGRVLLFGGQPPAAVGTGHWIEDPVSGALVRTSEEHPAGSSSWIFDPSTGSAVETDNLAFAMPGVGLLYRESVLLLSDGRVIAVEPIRREAGIQRVQYFDPASQSWTEGPSIDVGPIRTIGLFETAEGHLLVHGPVEVDVSSVQFGGEVFAYSNENHVMVFDGTSGARIADSLGPLTRPHWTGFGHSAILPDGRFLFIQGEELAAEESALFDPATSEWETLQGPDGSSGWHIIGLPQGDVIAIDRDSSVFRLNGSSLEWRSLADLPAGVAAGHPIGVHPWGFPVWEALLADGFGTLFYIPNGDEWWVLDHGPRRSESVVTSDGKLVLIDWGDGQVGATAWVHSDPISVAVPTR